MVSGMAVKPAIQPATALAPANDKNHTPIIMPVSLMGAKRVTIDNPSG